MLTIIGLIIGFVVFAISENEKKAYKKTIQINKKYKFITDDNNFYTFLKKEDLSIYENDILEYIKKTVENSITKNIYYLYLQSNFLGKNTVYDFFDYLKEHGKIIIDNDDLLGCSIIKDKNLIESIIANVQQTCADDIQSLEDFFNEKFHGEYYSIAYLDNDEGMRSFYTYGCVYTHKYLNDEGIQFEKNSKIYTIYETMIDSAIAKNIDDAQKEKDVSSSKYFFDNINKIIKDINMSFTNYLEIVSKEGAYLDEAIVIVNKEEILAENIKEQLFLIENKRNLYNAIYNNYKNKNDILAYFQYAFEKFPAPFWAINDITFEIKCNNKNNILHIETLLPSIDSTPKNVSVKSIDKEGSILYNKYSERELIDVYNNFIYQYIMSIIYYTFKIDREFYIDKLILNCKLRHIEKSTGRHRTDYVASIAFNSKDYFTLNFNLLDAKDCFIHYNGIASESFTKARSISPISSFNDTRGLRAAKNTSQRINLVTMPWRDFEFLVKEIFDKSYKGKNYSIELTQASRDGGVDIIIHDYDPINGGIILVQVKRYSHIVGIEAVRALYGILSDHGAMKGILVTTSHFGRDARNFVKNKPLTLIDGENLLKLLENSGFSNFYISPTNYK